MPTKQASTTSAQSQLSPWIVLLLASACGLIVANLYYAQTVVGPISMTTGLSSAASGLIVTLTQLGYVIGLLFIVPLSDIIENRRLATLSLIVLVLALIIAAFAPQAGLFLMVSLFIGVGSVVAQILVPYATYLTSEEQRGRVVGNVMSGLLLGIMLARPVASFITSIWGWQAVFIFSAIMIALLTILLSRTLPVRQPKPNLNYGQLIISLGTLLKKLPSLRRRALYQASLFGAFSLFWTTVPMRLANDFNMSQQGIAWFALAGVGGAIAAPIAGRLADRGLTRILTGAAMVIALLSFAVTYLFQSNSTTALIVLLIAAITLDMAVSGNLVLGQRVIYSLGNEARGRINGIFMSIFFIGGAAGSSIGSWSYAYGGWALTSIIGIAMPLLAFLYYSTEKNTRHIQD
ncbi:MFS transporter [Paenibacillus sp. MER 99-2]|uniref:MFS transporter n=1 Tax=Paenibacillus sp. MER 99-2 TaxID=2939572 RepID=UPI00203E4A73|nr:MFS transporter [Paenibacillus sp. MER 99-2]MCM3174794.1 MFS transporter [Paenibacillus sp. MER 99-2]